MSVIWDKYLPQRQKMYLGLVRPAKKSDQSAHLHSLIRAFARLILDSLGCKVPLCGQ